MHASDVAIASRRRVDICTIIAKNYVAHARVLASSFRDHHPDGTCYVLVLDEFEGHIDPAAEPFEVITPAELSIGGFDEMAAGYSVLELSTAVKPWLLRTLLERVDGGIVYLDPDIEVFAPLDELSGLMETRGLVLTPHVLESMPRDGKKPSETDILVAGVYNLGFIGLGNDVGAQRLLDWWSERLRTDCVVDPANGYFVDQRWMDFAPSLVEQLEILRDPGYNVAYWNLPGRRVENVEGVYRVNGRPLRFFHYSGYDPRRPEQLSKHQNRTKLADVPVVAELCDRYADKLVEAGFLEASQWPYTYDQLGDGTPITPGLRKLVASAVEDGIVSASVFSEEGATELLCWLQEPASRGGAHGVTRYLEHVYDEREDLQRVYPDLDGADGSGLVGWAWVHGRHELPIPDSLLPGDEPDFSVQASDVPVGADAQPLGPPRPWGVNVAGYFHSELGIGEAARQVISGLDACGVPVRPVGLVAPLSRQGHHYGASAPYFPYPINIVCVNADGLPGFSREVGTDWAAYRYTIGIWFWEVSTFPERWVSSFDYLDEVWVATQHIADALEPVAPIPVTKVTVPIRPLLGAPLTRRELGMPDGFVFLFAFDYNSVFERKNPLAVVEAFMSAFPDVGVCSLVLKSINHEHDESNHERLREATADRPDIVLIDRYVSLQEKNSMMAACDCYVSLHRSEGLGLTMGEAMAFGKPVIATGYSGNLEFMTEQNSLLVRYETVPIGHDAAPYPPDGTWAEPDLEHATELMRRVRYEPALGQQLGARAAADIASRHSPQAAGATMAQRLESIRSKVPVRPGIGEFADDVLRGVGTGGVREALRSGPAEPPNGSIRRKVRAGAAKALGPHWKEVDALTLDVINDVVTASGKALEDLRRTIAVSEGSLLGTIRGLEEMLRAEQRVSGERIAQRLRDAEDALRRLQGERPRVDRWPVEVPWSHEYNRTHRSFVAAALDDPRVLRAFAGGLRLPPLYGIGLDERVVEFPWLLSRGLRGHVLDAGSTLNHAHVLERLPAEVAQVTVTTLVSEQPALEDERLTFEDGDLRALTYGDDAFDTVACISTLEHVGMDNTMYGSDAAPAHDPEADGLQAVRELRRVLAPGGRLLLTVPYGVAENLGWERQFGAAEVEAVVQELGRGDVSIDVFRYDERGWQSSTLDEASDRHYRDYTRDPRPVADHAAAARAVACIEFTAPEST